jgi:hypothetical protein
MGRLNAGLHSRHGIHHECRVRLRHKSDRLAGRLLELIRCGISDLRPVPELLGE